MHFQNASGKYEWNTSKKFPYWSMSKPDVLIPPLVTQKGPYYHRANFEVGRLVFISLALNITMSPTLYLGTGKCLLSMYFDRMAQVCLMCSKTYFVILLDLHPVTVRPMEAAPRVVIAVGQ